MKVGIDSKDVEVLFHELSVCKDLQNENIYIYIVFSIIVFFQ